MDNNSETVEENSNNDEYNNINPILIENKIIDNLKNDDIEIRQKRNKNKNIIYRQFSNNNDYSENKNNNFDDINKESKFITQKEKYKKLYSNMNRNNNYSKENYNKENYNNLNIEHSNGENNDSDNNEQENQDDENNYNLNNNYNNNEPYFRKNNNNKKLMTKVLNLNNNTYKNQKDQYEDEINKLKEEIANLENDNDILSNQLIEEERKNEELLLLKKEKEENDNSILTDISHCLQVNSLDEILPKLTEMINYLTKYNNDKSSKVKEDIISKLKSLYIVANNSKEKKENISIQDLWRWIKQLIEEVDELSIEKERYEEIYNRESNDIYKNFCEKLIQEFGLNSFDELKFFINDLMTKNDINKKRVEKLRKVLMNNNNEDKEESFSSIMNNNNYNYKEENEFDINNNNYIRNNNVNNRENKNYNQNYYYNDNQF